MIASSIGKSFTRTKKRGAACKRLTTGYSLWRNPPGALAIFGSVSPEMSMIRRSVS